MVRSLKNKVIIKTPEGYFLQYGNQSYESIDLTSYKIPKYSIIFLDGYRCEINQKQLINYGIIKGIYLFFKLKISHHKIHNDWRFYYIYKLKGYYYLVTITMADMQFTNHQYQSAVKYDFLINTYQKALNDLKKNFITDTGFIIVPYFGRGWRILCYKNFVIFFVKYVKNNSVSLEQLITETKLYLSNRFGIALNDINYHQENIDFAHVLKNSAKSYNFIYARLFQLFLTPKHVVSSLFLNKLKSSLVFYILFGLLSAIQVIYLSSDLLNFYRLSNNYAQRKIILRHDLKQLSLNTDYSFQKIQHNLNTLNHSDQWFKRFKQLSSIITPTLILKELVWKNNTIESLQIRFRTVQDWDTALSAAQWQQNCLLTQKLWCANYNVDTLSQTVKVKFDD